MSVTLQALSDMIAPSGERLWLPNARGVMQEASALVFNDAPWLEAQGINFIHPKLSYEVSSLLLHTHASLEEGSRSCSASCKGFVSESS